MDLVSGGDAKKVYTSSPSIAKCTREPRLLKGFLQTSSPANLEFREQFLALQPPPLCHTTATTLANKFHRKGGLLSPIAFRKHRDIQ